MSDQIAELYVTLRAVTTGFTKGMGEAAASGESFSSKVRGGPVNALANLGKAATVGAIGVAAASVKMAGDFQANMLKLKTSAGNTGDFVGGKFTGDLKTASDGILKLAVSTATSTKELSAGMYTIQSAGYNAADGLKILRAAAEGARAEGAPLKEMGDALTTVMKDYRFSADQATNATNGLIAIVAHGKTTMAEMSSSIHNVAPYAKSAGVSFAEMGGALATLTSHGISADQATQNLRHLIVSLGGPSQKAGQYMEQMGLKVSDVTGKLGQRGLTGTLDMLVSAIGRHVRGGMVMVDTFNKSKSAAESLNAMLKGMPPGLQKLATAFMNNKISAFDYGKAIKNLPAAQASMGTQFATLVRRAEGFSNAVKSGTGVAQPFQAALKNILGDSTSLGVALNLTGKNMGDFKTNVKAVGDAAKHGGKDVENWKKIQETFNFQMDQLRRVVETTAIRIGDYLIPKISAAVGWFKKHQDVAKTVGEELKRVAGVVVWLGGVLGTVLLPPLKWVGEQFAHHKILAQGLAVIIGGILTAAITLFAARSVMSIARTTKEIVTLGGAIGKLKNAGIGGKLVSGWDTIRLKAMYAGEGVKKFGSTVADLSKSAGSAGVGKISSGWDTVRLKAMSAGEAMGKVAGAAKSGISTAAELATKWSKAAAEVVIFNLRMAAYLMWQGLVSAATKIWTGIQAAFNLVMDMNPIALVVIAIAALVAGVIYAYTHFKVFRDIVNGVFDWLKSAVMAVINFVTDHWRLIITIIGGPLGLVVALVTKYWSQIWSFIQTAVRGVLSAIGWIARVPGQVAGWFGQMASSAANKAMGLVNWLTGLPGAILRALGNTGSMLYNAGRNIIIGLINGVWSMAQSLWNTVSNIVSTVRSYLPFSPAKIGPLSGSGSPDIAGGKIVSMLAGGIVDQAPLMDAAMATVTGKVTGRRGALSLGINANVLGAGSGGAVIHNHQHVTVNVAGSVLAEHELMAVVQKHSLRTNRRNATNGLSKVGGF